MLFFQTNLSLRHHLTVDFSEFFCVLFLLDFLEYRSAYNKGDIYIYI